MPAPGGARSSMEALEAHLRAQPDDWPSWLVYADWLTDQGDVRGKLIALEHYLATASLSPKDQRTLTARKATIVARYKPRWRAGLELPPNTELRWRHGFVVHVKMNGIPRPLEPLAALAAHPTARFLAALSLRGCELGGEEATALARMEPLAGLTALDLTNNGLGTDGMTALAQSPILRSLQALELGRNRLGSEAAASLAQSQTLGSLRTLVLSGNEIGDEGTGVLSRYEALISLWSLDLSSNELGDEGGAALARSETLRHCEVLA